MMTMNLIETKPRTEELMVLSDSELESWFADTGLAVAVVPHCDTAACAMCFPTALPAVRAA